MVQVQKYINNINRSIVGTILIGPIGGGVVGMASAAMNGTFEQERIVKQQDKERFERYKNSQNSQNQERSIDRKLKDTGDDGTGGEATARAAAKKAGLDQGDNWKMYRSAQAGDKRAQEVVKQWESEKKSSSSEKTEYGTQKLSTKSINDKVKYAMKTGNFDMEFLESNGDMNATADEYLKGKDLENAYKKYLEKYGYSGVEMRK